MDESGVVDVSDAVLLAKYVAGQDDIIISDQGLVNGDADNSNQLSNEDVITIIRMIIGLI